MALSKPEVLALIPAIPTPYVCPYNEYTAIISSDGTNIAAASFMINQLGDSSQDGVNDILWAIASPSSFRGDQSSAPFTISLTDAKPITLFSDTGELIFAVPTFTSTSQITYDLYYGDGTQPVSFPVFMTSTVLLTIRVFI